MAVTLTRINAEELQERKRMLLERAHMQLDELRERAETFSITPEQRDILDEINDIEFLENND